MIKPVVDNARCGNLGFSECIYVTNEKSCEVYILTNGDVRNDLEFAVNMLYNNVQ